MDPPGRYPTPVFDLSSPRPTMTTDPVQLRSLPLPMDIPHPMARPSPDETNAHRPVLLFDGDCGFCRFWVDRWQRQTRGTIDFEPSETIPDDHPVLKTADLDAAIHLVEPDGRVTQGAEAALRVREIGMNRPRLARLYRRSPHFAGLSEWAYRRIARNRPFFSCLTRIFFGRRTG